MPRPQIANDTALFTEQLARYKAAIDADILAYCKQLQQQTLKEFGANSRLEVDAYISILQRGGKRIRGALTMVGYEMAGGTNRQMIIKAARAIEMLHAYILIIDDFQDRSQVRRGGPTAHKILAREHSRQEWGGNSEHFGASIALNAALSGAHAAQEIITQLVVPPELKLRALELLNHTMRITAHGQTSDILNEVVAEVSSENIEHVLEWKTAHYTFINPLSVGMTLAGAPRDDILSISDYSIHAGKAFQITDDILGTFGTEFDSGKSPMDDTREGKRTVITEYALSHTNDDNKNFLIRMLGNNELTPAQFERCKDILVGSGALKAAQVAAENHVALALSALESTGDTWEESGLQFLRGLVQSLLGRTA
jgi:geranylgeranyl diphosphate synthase type I